MIESDTVRHFLGSIGWLGISDDPAFLGEPETNACAERSWQLSI
jgi:hypothetical protein